MPRLDNSNKHNLSILKEWGENHWLKAEFDPDNPGEMLPMDVCLYCYAEYHLIGDVEHPSYEDDHYTCAICQRRLDEDDD